MGREIEVVAGVIVGDVPRRFLITRKSKPPHVGKWEFPGGKIEEGETHQEALGRELMEELGLDIEIGPNVVTTQHVYDDINIVLHAYFCHVDEKALSQLTLIDHDKARWITLDDIAIDAVIQRRDTEEDQSTLLHSKIDPEFERKHLQQKLLSRHSEEITTPNVDNLETPAPDADLPKLNQRDFMAADIAILKRLAEMSFFIDVSPRLRL